MITLDLDAFAAEHGTTTIDELLFLLRRRYADHREIATLASTELVANDPALVDQVEERLALYFNDIGNCFQDAWQGVRNALGHRARLARCPTTEDLVGHYSGMPAVVLGAGPGVDTRWDAIAEARRGALLFVCDAMVRPCMARGIVPDFVCAIERLPDVYDCMVGIDKTGMTLIAPAVIEPRLVDDFAGRVIWAWRACLLEQWTAPAVRPCNVGHSSGTLAVGAAALAGCSPIYLVGHDLCMQGGETHSATADAMVQLTAANLDRDYFHTRIATQNWCGAPVTTINLWQMLRADIEHILAEHPRQSVILTGDGLAIRGAQPGELHPGTLGRLPRLRDGTMRVPERAVRGNDITAHYPQLIRDCDTLVARCQSVLDRPTPDGAERLRLSTIVGQSTAVLWGELLQSVYEAGLVRLHLQVASEADTHRHVAKTIMAIARLLREELPRE